MPDEAFRSEKAANDYNAAVLTWGRDMAAQVDRICRWAESLGMTGLSCPPAN